MSPVQIVALITINLTNEISSKRRNGRRRADRTTARPPARCAKVILQLPSDSHLTQSELPFKLLSRARDCVTRRITTSTVACNAQQMRARRVTGNARTETASRRLTTVCIHESQCASFIIFWQPAERCTPEPRLAKNVCPLPQSRQSLGKRQSFRDRSVRPRASSAGIL